MTPTYAIGVVFVLVAVLFVLASPQDWYGAFKTIHVVFAVDLDRRRLLDLRAGVHRRAGARRQEGRTILAEPAASVSQRVFTPSALIVLFMGIAMMLNDTGRPALELGQLLGHVRPPRVHRHFVIGFFVLGPAAKQMEGLWRAAAPTRPRCTPR